MAVPIPDLSIPLSGADGRMSLDWYRYFKSRDSGLRVLPDVSTTAPTNGQVLIYNSTTKLWTPGAN